ncbi:winged helix-turn-helix transcriptional regulator [Micromonospora sp. SCSIO 07396]
MADRHHYELRAALPGIATNLLSTRLQHLAAAGIVQRCDEAGRKAVRYRLTDLGQGLRGPVHELVRWGATFMAAGPRPDDVVQPQWLGLAVEALLPATGLPTGGGIGVHADGLDLTVRLTPDGVHVTPGRDDGVDATVTGPTAAVLGLFAGALPPRSSAARIVEIHDPHGLLARVLTVAATGTARPGRPVQTGAPVRHAPAG